MIKSYHYWTFKTATSIYTVMTKSKVQALAEKKLLKYSKHKCSPLKITSVKYEGMIIC